MRILVFSDSHQKIYDMKKAAASQKAAALIHLGDNARDIDCFSELPIPVFSVRGNCDFAGAAPDELFITLGGKKIFICHGHLFGVKGGTGNLIKTAKEKGADIALFGHTHTPYNKYENGIYLLNPGSISEPRSGGKRYGVIDIGENYIFCNTIEV